MRRMLRICGFSLALAGCVRSEAFRLLLASVERDTATYCAESQWGCQFGFEKTETGWLVRASLIFYVGGQRAYPVGNERGYVYDARGKLLDTMPGM